MEADGIQTPELELEPVSRACDRPVIDVAAGHPGAEHAAGLEHGVVHQMEIVVPDESAMPGRLIDQQDRHAAETRRRPAFGRAVASKIAKREAGGLRPRDLVTGPADRRLEPAGRRRRGWRSSVGRGLFRLRPMRPFRECPFSGNTQYLNQALRTPVSQGRGMGALEDGCGFSRKGVPAW